MLERCIESILLPGTPEDEYEIIVVDDGSADPPLWIEEKYGKAARLILSEHGGPGAARNRGIYEAKGKYIQFVDADDYLINTAQLKKCIETLKCESPQILRFRYSVSYDGKTPEPCTNEPEFSHTISGAAYMADNNLSGSPCTYFFRRDLSIRKDIRFPENRFHEDEEFNTILHYHAQTLIDSNAQIYCYSIRKGSTTANSSPEFEKKRIDDLMAIISRLSFFKDSFSKECNIIQERAIRRKLNMLCVDAILNMMYAGFKAKDIHRICVGKLSPLGLYPLQKEKYSYKYRVFRLLANTKAGMRILRTLTPKKKPAKK